MDIEFLVQMLQLQHARKNPRLRTPNTLSALAELHAAGLLGDEDYRFFDGQYRFLRLIEGRLRLLEFDRPRHAAPRRHGVEQAGPSFALFQQRRAASADYDSATGEIRRRFERTLEAAAARG